MKGMCVSSLYFEKCHLRDGIQDVKRGGGCIRWRSWTRIVPNLTFPQFQRLQAADDDVHRPVTQTLATVLGMCCDTAE